MQLDDLEPMITETAVRLGPTRERVRRMRCVTPTWMFYGRTDTMRGWVGNTRVSNGPSSSSW